MTDPCRVAYSRNYLIKKSDVGTGLGIDQFNVIKHAIKNAGFNYVEGVSTTFGMTYISFSKAAIESGDLETPRYALMYDTADASVGYFLTPYYGETFETMIGGINSNRYPLANPLLNDGSPRELHTLYVVADAIKGFVWVAFFSPTMLIYYALLSDFTRSDADTQASADSCARYGVSTGGKVYSPWHKNYMSFEGVNYENSTSGATFYTNTPLIGTNSLYHYIPVAGFTSLLMADVYTYTPIYFDSSFTDSGTFYSSYTYLAPVINGKFNNIKQLLIGDTLPALTTFSDGDETYVTMFPDYDLAYILANPIVTTTSPFGFPITTTTYLPFYGFHMALPVPATGFGALPDYPTAFI